MQLRRRRKSIIIIIGVNFCRMNINDVHAVKPRLTTMWQGKNEGTQAHWEVRIMSILQRYGSNNGLVSDSTIKLNICPWLFSSNTWTLNEFRTFFSDFVETFRFVMLVYAVIVRVIARYVSMKYVCNALCKKMQNFLS